MKAFIIVCIAIAAVVCPVSAGPTFPFVRFTSNTPSGEPLPTLTMTVDPWDDGVQFTFKNIAPDGVTGTITAIYFDDGRLLAPASILAQSPGVEFYYDGEPISDKKDNKISPGNLPAGNELDPPFVASAGLSVDIENAVAAGIDPGQWLTVGFELQSGQDYDGVLAALYKGFSDPDTTDATLRVGLHVQRLGPDDDSDSFILVVPTPGAFVLAGIGLGGFGWLRRRRIL